MGDNLTYDRAKQVDVKSYLQSRGRSFDNQGFCRSPFTRDSTSSFKYYPATNSWFDWSAGFGGDVIKLVMLLDGVTFQEAIQTLGGGSFKAHTPSYKEINKRLNEEFSLPRFKTTRLEEIEEIKAYAASRSIKEGYECGVFFTKDESGNWVRNPSMMYVLYDADLKPCGAKFRRVRKNGERFTCRGRQGLYILENLIDGSYQDPTIYFVESESSANSLWQFCKENNRNVVVISFGSVGSRVVEIPNKYKSITNRFLIIDYDGDETLYFERLRRHENLKAKPIKMILPKGEDINSLYSSKQMYKITNLLFNG